MKVIAVSGIWFRSVPTRYLSNPLGFVHSFAALSRYSAGKGHYPLLYLGPDRFTALLEYRALVQIPGHTGLPRLLPTGLAGSVAVVPVTVKLNAVIDLGDPGTRTQTVQELTGNWRAYPLLSAGGSVPQVRSRSSTAPTQDLGVKLAARRLSSKCEAFLAPSAVRPQVCNLVVFPDQVTISYTPLRIAVSVP